MEHTTITSVATVLTVATAHSHAGEILQGAVRRADGVHRLLYSLPAPTLWTRAELLGTPGQALAIDPPWAQKALSASRLLLRQLGLPQPDAMIRLTTNIPVGKGCESSTADILAALRALLAFLRVKMTEEELARLVVEAEEASDGSILSRPAIFRHREGIVDQYLPGVFPGVRVIVIDAQPGVIIPTVSMPRARYSEEQLQAFAVLIARLRRALREGNAADLGAVATASARINQQFLPKQHFEDLIALVEGEGGHGVAAAHSGTVLAMLFPIGHSAGRLSYVRAVIADLGMPIVAEYVLGQAAQWEVAA